MEHHICSGKANACPRAPAAPPPKLAKHASGRQTWQCTHVRHCDHAACMGSSIYLLQEITCAPCQCTRPCQRAQVPRNGLGAASKVRVPGHRLLPLGHTFDIRADNVQMRPHLSLEIGTFWQLPPSCKGEISDGTGLTDALLLLPGETTGGIAVVAPCARFAPKEGADGP